MENHTKISVCRNHLKRKHVTNQAADLAAAPQNFIRSCGIMILTRVFPNGIFLLCLFILSMVKFILALRWYIQCHLKDNHIKTQFMSIKSIIVNPVEGLSQWEELFLENLIYQHKYGLPLMFSGSMNDTEMSDLGIISFNLSKYWFATVQLYTVYRVTPLSKRLPITIGIADILAVTGKDKLALNYYNIAIGLIHKFARSSIDLYNYCISQKKLLEQKFEKMDENHLEELKLSKPSYMLFTDYEFFETKIRIFEYFLSGIPDAKMVDFKFTIDVIKDWNSYKSTSSIVLSGIVTKGNLDLEKSLEATFDFISSFPLKLLLKKMMSYSSIEYIIDENLLKFEDAMFGGEPTMEQIITKSENFHKDQNYLKYLVIYLKSKLILSVKKFILANTDKTFIICEFDLITKFCQLLIELIEPDFKMNLLKKYLEKRKKLLHNYQNDLDLFQDEVLKIGMTSIIYTFLAYKDDNALTKYCPDPKIRLLKTKLFKKSVFMLRTFYVMFKARNLQLENKTIIKKILVYSDEVMAFLVAEEILPESNENPLNKYRRTNKFFTERLISGYISLLEMNAGDDMSNSTLIKNLMYCVLLQGGYHISVIWFLNRLSEFAQMKDALALIGNDDDCDAVYSAMFGGNLSQYKSEFELVIKKICMAQESVEVIKLKSYENNEEVEVEKLQSYTHKNGHHLILPQVIINSDNELVFLPEFCNFIQDGNTIRMNLTGAKSEIDKGKRPHDSKSKINSNTYIKLKGILRPTRESIYECIKKSDVLIESILNSGKIALVGELKKSHQARQLIDDACGRMVMPYLGEDEILEEYEDWNSERREDKTMLEHVVGEKVQQFRREFSPSESEREIRDSLWRRMVESGAAGFNAKIILE